MGRRTARLASGFAGALVACCAAAGSARAQVPGRCEVPVAQRASEAGCYILAAVALGELPAVPLFWHLYAYPDRATAEAATDPRATVVEAHGRIWLLAVAAQDWRPPAASAWPRSGRSGPAPGRATPRTMSRRCSRRACGPWPTSTTALRPPTWSPGRNAWRPRRVGSSRGRARVRSCPRARRWCWSTRARRCGARSPRDLSTTHLRGCTTKPVPPATRRTMISVNRAGFLGGILAWITRLGAPPSDRNSAPRLRPAAGCRWARAAGGGCGAGSAPPRRQSPARA